MQTLRCVGSRWKKSGVHWVLNNFSDLFIKESHIVPQQGLFDVVPQHVQTVHKGLLFLKVATWFTSNKAHLDFLSPQIDGSFLNHDKIQNGLAICPELATFLLHHLQWIEPNSAHQAIPGQIQASRISGAQTHQKSDTDGASPFSSALNRTVIKPCT